MKSLFGKSLVVLSIGEYYRLYVSAQFATFIMILSRIFSTLFYIKPFRNIPTKLDLPSANMIDICELVKPKLHIFDRNAIYAIYHSLYSNDSNRESKAPNSSISLSQIFQLSIPTKKPLVWFQIRDLLVRQLQHSITSLQQLVDFANHHRLNTDSNR
ncbi:MAG: hypothetical protein MHMPM18_003157, partial [Marteilia pararefringens]